MSTISNVETHSLAGTPNIKKPRRYLIRMTIFVGVAVAISAFLYPQLQTALSFWSCCLVSCSFSAKS